MDCIHRTAPSFLVSMTIAYECHMSVRHSNSPPWFRIRCIVQPAPSKPSRGALHELAGNTEHVRNIGVAAKDGD